MCATNVRIKRRDRNQTGAAQISEFSAALYVFLLVLLIPLINLISLSAATATGFLAAKYSASRAGDSLNYMEAISAAAAATKEITESGLGEFSALKPVGGYDSSGMNLYLTDTNVSNNVNITHGPNTPAVSALDQDKYLYSYDTVLTYDVGPFLNLSMVPFIGDVAGLGKPIRMKFQGNRTVEHLDGITIGGGGYITTGSVMGSTSSAGVLGAYTGGTAGGGAGGGFPNGSYALNSASAGSAAAMTPMAVPPRRPWQVASTTGITRYIPNVLSSFYIQLQGELDLSVPYDVWDVDLYSTTPEQVAAMQAMGGYVIAYMNAGAWQPGMPDSDLYPDSVIGKQPMKGWPEERWLDIRQIETLRPIIRSKIAEAKAKGFNAVDPDNMDGYTNTTEFGLTKADQIAFAKMIAEEAHALGMAVMLKNAGDMMSDLVNDFDGTVAEQAYKYKEAAIYQPMRDAGKPVFVIEYNNVKRKNVQDAIARGFNVVRAKKQLKRAPKMVTPS